MEKEFSLMGVHFWNAESLSSFQKVFKYNEYLRKVGDISYEDFLKLWKESRKKQ